MINKLGKGLSEQLRYHIVFRLVEQINAKAQSQLEFQLWTQLWNQLWGYQIDGRLGSHIESEEHLLSQLPDNIDGNRL